RWRYGIIISLAVCFSLLSGHYQISLYLLFALIVFIFAYSQKKLQSFCFVLIGILLSSIQLFLTLHAFLQSDRGEKFTSGAIPWNYLITLFSPDFYGNPVTRNDWYGQYAEWSSYVGVIPLLLAVYSIFFLKNKIKIFFMLLAGISIMISFSSPLNNLLYHLRIPIISTSVATRMIVLFSFSLIVLGVYGLDQLLEDWNKIRFSRIVKFSIGIVVFLGFLWFFILFSGSLPSEYAEIAKRNSILSSGFAILFIIFSFFGLAFRKIRVFILCGIILVTSFDMLRFSLKWMPFDPKEYVYPSLPVIEFLQRNIGNSRVFGTFGNELATYFQIPIIEGYDAMYQKRYGEFLSSASNGTIQPLERSVARIDKHGLYTNTWINLLGVEYVLYRKSDGRNVWTFPHWEYPQYVSVYQDEKYEILRNMNSLPRAFLADLYYVVLDKHDIIKKLVDINVASTIILEEQPTVKLSQENAQTVNIIQYTPNKIHIDVQTNSPKLLFLSDVFDSGWRAKVNGKEAKIFRTNYAFRSIVVPEGKSTVHLYYQPRLFIFGCLLSGITLLFIVAESVRRFMYDRRHL
ncbi:MAG: YfhO family protein, partial [Patescibacteria group bacterium]|nr:YfhO family protein [Patescibacteria group bacterium]